MKKLKKMDKINNFILESQYALINENGLETSHKILDRVANAMANIEKNKGFYKKKYYWMMSNNYFLPSGRILNNSDSKQSQLASCFVLPIKDNFNSLFNTLKLSANCHRLGGGTGFNLSKIREKGAAINTSESSGASGPVSYIKLFDAETKFVMAGGKRRGANIAILNVYHPDILDFINCKNNFSLKNFNISILIDNAFMNCVEKNEKINLVSPFDRKIKSTINATEIWSNIVEQMLKIGEPGVLFVDTINQKNPLRHKYGKLEIANPCGEQIMYSYESSFLGSINLANLFKSEKNDIDWELFEELIYLGVRFLDGAIDICKYPNHKIEKVTTSFRRIGLGIMGFSDLLVRMNIPYNSVECLAFIEKIGGFFKLISSKASESLAAEKGVFPNYDKTEIEVERRNVAITAIAPTGTISMVANCSSGIEPKFSPYYKKDVITEHGIEYFDNLLLNLLVKSKGLKEEKAKKLIATNTFRAYLTEKENLAYIYSNDIDYKWHINVLAKWQEYIDNGISKTINLPNKITKNEISELLKVAYLQKCKGVTVYRQGSHPNDLLIDITEQQEIQSKEKTKMWIEQTSYSKITPKKNVMVEI